MESFSCVAVQEVELKCGPRPAQPEEIRQPPSLSSVGEFTGHARGLLWLWVAGCPAKRSVTPAADLSIRVSASSFAQVEPDGKCLSPGNIIAGRHTAFGGTPARFRASVNGFGRFSNSFGAEGYN